MRAFIQIPVAEGLHVSHLLVGCLVMRTVVGCERGFAADKEPQSDTMGTLRLLFRRLLFRRLLVCKVRLLRNRQCLGHHLLGVG